MIDLDLLLKLRLVVARVGEMDLAGWWNTNGQLGATGTAVVRRGFRRTHHFAQSRAVFAVAAHRCSEVYDAPGSVTLWRLPPSLEDEFERRWEHWLDDAQAWAPFFDVLADCSVDLEAELTKLELVTSDDRAASARLRRSAEQRAVQIPGEFDATDAAVRLLALGFARGEPGNLAVPIQAAAS
jgi:hypothetical protein